MGCPGRGRPRGRARGVGKPPPPRGRLRTLGRGTAVGVVRRGRRLRPVDRTGSALGRTAESPGHRARGRSVSRLLEPPLALCGNFGRAGPAVGCRRRGGAGRGRRGSVPLRPRGPDGTGRERHRRVRAKRPGSEGTSPGVTSLLLAPGVWAWGRGGAELRGAAEDSLKPRLGGPEPGGGAHLHPFSGWVRELLLAGAALAGRAARRGMRPWVPGAAARFLRADPPPRGRARGARPSPAPALLPRAAVPACGRELRAGRALGMCLRCWMGLGTGGWTPPLELASRAG